MNAIMKIVGAAAVAGITLLPLVFIFGGLGLDSYKWIALALTVVWFVAAGLAAATAGGAAAE